MKIHKLERAFAKWPNSSMENFYPIHQTPSYAHLPSSAAPSSRRTAQNLAYKKLYQIYCVRFSRKIFCWPSSGPWNILLTFFCFLEHFVDLFLLATHLALLWSGLRKGPQAEAWWSRSHRSHAFRSHPQSVSGIWYRRSVQWTSRLALKVFTLGEHTTSAGNSDNFVAFFATSLIFFTFLVCLTIFLTLLG